MKGVGGQRAHNGNTAKCGNYFPVTLSAMKNRLDETIFLNKTHLCTCKQINKKCILQVDTVGYKNNLRETIAFYEKAIKARISSQPCVEEGIKNEKKSQTSFAKLVWLQCSNFTVKWTAK